MINRPFPNAMSCGEKEEFVTVAVQLMPFDEIRSALYVVPTNTAFP